MKAYRIMGKMITGHCTVIDDQCARVLISDFCGRRTGKRTCTGWGNRKTSKCSPRVSTTNCTQWVCEHADLCKQAMVEGRESPRRII